MIDKIYSLAVENKARGIYIAILDCFNKDEPSNAHGIIVSNLLSNYAEEAIVIKYNIIEKNKISSNLIKASLEDLNEKYVDILIINYGDDRFDESVYNLLNQLAKKGVSIFCARDNRYSRAPSNFDCVYSVGFDMLNNKDTVEIYNKDINVGILFITNFLNFNPDNKIVDIIIDDLHNATGCIPNTLFAIIIAIIKAENPLISLKSIFDLYFTQKQIKVSLPQKTVSYNSISNACYLVDSEYLDLVTYTHDLVIDVKRIYQINNSKWNALSIRKSIQGNGFENIIMLNTDIEKAFSGLLADMNCHHIRDFIQPDEKNNNKEVNYIKNLCKPVIQIFGQGPNTMKLYLLINLYSKFKKEGYKSYQITFNEIGYLFGFDTCFAKNKIIIPDDIYSLNHKIKNIEDNVDIIITEVAENSSALIHKDSAYYGYEYTFLNALNTDIVIYCIYSDCDINEVIHIINSYKNYKLILYISNFVSNKKSTSHANIYEPSISDEKRIDNLVKNILDIGFENVFKYKNINSLYQKIIDILT